MARKKLQKNLVQKKRAKRSKAKTIKDADTIEGSDDSLLSVLRKVNSLLYEVKALRVVQVSSVVFREKVKDFVKAYFRVLRPELATYKMVTSELDLLMQSLMLMANAYTSRTIYKGTLEKIRKALMEMETTREHAASDILVNSRTQGARVSQSVIENISIIETLEKTVPTAALSYKQALSDLQSPRSSYRGTVAELREVLREVLDYLAPDKEVKKIQGFKLEEDLKNPTMRQKVRFILKNRNKPATAIEAPEEAASIVDEGVAKLVRAIYNRGSLSAHTHGEGQLETVQIKRYLDTVLCELLEIK